MITLTVRWSAINQAWVTMFGDSPTGIGPDNRTLFSTLDELRPVLESCGLKLGNAITSFGTPRGFEVTA